MAGIVNKNAEDCWFNRTVADRMNLLNEFGVGKLDAYYLDGKTVEEVSRSNFIDLPGMVGGMLTLSYIPGHDFSLERYAQLQPKKETTSRLFTNPDSLIRRER
jgi:hypothetical protein